MSLQVWVNGFELVNGPVHRLNVRETTGLFDPVALVEPGTQDTFEGSYRVRQTTVDFGVREITIVGSLYVASVSYADKLRALDWLQTVYAPRPSRVLVGSLELAVDFGRVQIAADELKRLTGTIRYTVSGTAVPATYSTSVGAGLGFSQGLAVDSSAPNEAATTVTMASGVGTITVLGDAPCAAVVTLKGAASTTYYLATSATGRRIPVTTDANGMGRIDERSGFWLVPGSRTITAYAAASGTTTLTTITAMSLFGTRWQFTANQAAGNVTRFDLGPVLNVARTASSGLTATSNITAGYVFNGNTNPAASGTDGLVLAATPDVPRIGRIWENRRNWIKESANLPGSLWSRSSVSFTSFCAAPDDIGDAFRYTSSAADGFTSQTVTGLASGIAYTFSVYLRAASPNTVNIYIVEGGSATSSACSVTSTWTRFTVTRTLTGTSPQVQIGGGTTWSTNEVLEIWGPQLEIGSTASAYQQTTSTAIDATFRNYPAGLVLEGQGQNLCLYSEDQSNAAWVKGAGGVTSNAAVAPDGATTADRLLFSSPFDASTYQILTGLSSSSLSYTFSAWVKAVTGTVDVLMQVQTVSAGVPTGTDVFTDVTTTVGTYWTRITQTGTSANTSLALLLSAGASFDVWGVHFELGTAATSYMPTTTVVTTRLSDVGGVVNPHNLLFYSEPVSQSSIGTAAVSNLWMRTGWTTSTTPVAGPLAGIFDALSVTTTSTSTDNIRQAITPPGTVGGKVYTFSVWLRQNATTALVVLDVENQAGTSRATVNCRLDSTWRRYSLTVTMNAADTGLIAKIRGANAAGTIEIYGAQLVEGYAPGRYVRTTDTTVLNTTAIDASWSQNGYIEATIAWPVVAQPQALTHIIIGNAYGNVINGHRRIQIPSGSSNTFLAELYTSTTGRQVTFADSAIYSRGYGTLRIEWLNYRLSGIRYCLLRLYADGVLKVESNFAGVVTSWPAFDPTLLWQGPYVSGFTARGEQTTISNLTLGTPQLPAGAVPAGI